jgi:hypothetical protein
MQPVAVQLLQLQAMMPEVTLRPGQTLVARVAERHDHKGILMLAGKPIVAELPENVRAGDVLKLAVKDISADKVIMQMREAQETQQTQQNNLVPLSVPFPDGHPAHINFDDAKSGGEDREHAFHAVALTYESPALGPINLRIGMDPNAVMVEVRIAAGAPLEIAKAASELLSESLTERTGRPAAVSVQPRPGSFNVSA